MMAKWKQLLQKYRSMILYLVFGVLTTLVDITVCFVLYRVAAQAMNEISWLIHVFDVIGWIAAVSFAFVTNRKWVFQSREHGATAIIRELLTFAGGRVLTLLLQEGMIFVFYTLLNQNKYLVRIVASFVVVVLNYFISKLLVFRKKK